jgi:hypothetical protein
MTPKEALTEIQYQEKMRSKGFPYQVNNLVVAEIISALEKQIPKKPNYKTEELFRLCPNCDFPLPLHFKFCNVCGQALDWGDSE